MEKKENLTDLNIFEKTVTFDIILEKYFCVGLHICETKNKIYVF